jgi:predicted dinucleotide-binding enzyme
MRIGVIGTGKMGRALAAAWARAGHQAVLGSRNPERVRNAAAPIDAGIELCSIAEALRAGEVIALATPWHGTQAILEAAAMPAGRILIDATNPPGSAHPDGATDHAAAALSGAEQIAAWAPNGRVVKTLNAVAARIVGAENRLFEGRRVTVPYCGDDPAAKTTVAELIAAIDLEPYDAGPLRSARYLESLGRAMAGMDIAAGRGRDLGFSLLQRPTERS